jgi:hypothetical protein
MKEIQEIVNRQIQSMIEDGSIQKAIETNIEKAVNSAINSQFQSYGSLTKQIEAGLEEGLQINMKDMPFEVYNQQMLVAVKGKLGNLFKAEASGKFMAEMDKLLAPAPKELSITQLVEQIAGFWKTDEPWDADNLDDHATAELEESGHTSNIQSYSLKMWKQKESHFSPNQPDIHLYLFADRGIRINHKLDYNPTCFRDHEAFIFKLYSAGTIITGLDSFDPDDCELTLKEFED